MGLEEIRQITDQVAMWWGYISTVVTAVFAAGFHLLGRVKAAVAQTPNKADDAAVAKVEHIWNIAWRVFQAFSTYKGIKPQKRPTLPPPPPIGPTPG